MPVIFLLAAIDAGKNRGFWATVSAARRSSSWGTAVPLVLGILIGKGEERRKTAPR